MFLTNNEDDLQQYLKQKQNKYYVYLLIDPDTNLPFYVGKGKNLRCLQHEKDALNEKYPHRSVHRKIQSILKQHKHVIYKIIDFYETEDQAFKTETRLIEQYGRKDKDQGILCNLTEGGEGVSCQSTETKEKRAQHHRGRKRTQQTKQKIKQAIFYRYINGFSPNAQTRNKQRLNLLTTNHLQTEDVKNKRQQKTLRRVIQYDENHNIVKIWDSAEQAAKTLGYKSATNIRSCCKQILTKAHGFIWKYENDVFNQQQSKFVSMRIIQIHPENNQEVFCWLSIKFAAEQFNISPIQLYNCAKGKYKLSAGYKWKLLSSSRNFANKPIKQFDLKGNFIKTWQSAEQAAKTLNINSSGIRKCCNGKLKTSNGFIWYFENN